MSPSAEYAGGIARGIPIGSAPAGPAQGIPAGSKFTIGGVPCYLVEPRNRATFQDKALLLIPDATGASNPETRLLAGRFATEGNLLVLLPELVSREDDTPPDILDKYAALAGVGQSNTGLLTKSAVRVRNAVLGDRLAKERWRFRQVHTPQMKVPLLANIIHELETIQGITKFACVGVGWGADCMWPLAQAGAVDAWAVMHGQLHRSFIARVRVPGIVHCADSDPFMPDAEREGLQQALQQAQWTRQGCPMQFKYYPGTYHGFAIRGDKRGRDVRDAAIRESQAEVLRSTLAFFAEHLGASAAERYPRPAIDERRMASLEKMITPSEVCTAFLTEAEMLQRVSALQTNVSIA